MRAEQDRQVVEPRKELNTAGLVLGRIVCVKPHPGRKTAPSVKRSNVGLEDPNRKKEKTADATEE